MMKHPTLIGEDSSDKFRVNEVKFLQEQHAAVGGRADCGGWAQSYVAGGHCSGTDRGTTR